MEKQNVFEQETAQKSDAKNNKAGNWLYKNKWKILGGAALVVASAGITALLWRSSSFSEYGVDAVFHSLKFGGSKPDLKTECLRMAEETVIETTQTVVSANIDSTIFESAVVTKEVKVDGFVRNLPPTWHASAGKVAEALDKGIKLEPHQTIVDPYIKNV